MSAKPRASRRRIAEMSLLLRGLLDDIAAAGGMKGKVHREALDLVDAFARSGEAPPPGALAAARSAIAKVVGRIGVGSSPLLMALSHVPVELVLRMVEEGDDLGRYVIEHAVNSVVGRSPEGAAERVEALLAQAHALADGIDEVRCPAPTDLADLPVHDLDLPAIAIAHLVARGAHRGGKHADAAATTALLTDRGRPVSPRSCLFEAAYGGLELFETDPDAAALVAGPYAFFSASPGYRGNTAMIACPSSPRATTCTTPSTRRAAASPTRPWSRVSFARRRPTVAPCSRSPSSGALSRRTPARSSHAKARSARRWRRSAAWPPSREPAARPSDGGATCLACGSIVEESTAATVTPDP